MRKGKADERLEKIKKREKKVLITVGIIILIGILFWGVHKQFFSDDEGNSIDYQQNPGSGNDVIIKRSEISDGEFHYYATAVDGVSVKYFVVMDDNGEVRTAFDACEVCYGAKKGYTQDSDEARCENCGRSFPVDELGVKNKDEGGCWPGYLPNIIEGDDIIIKKSDLEEGKYLFS